MAAWIRVKSNKSNSLIVTFFKRAIKGIAHSHSFKRAILSKSVKSKRVKERNSEIPTLIILPLYSSFFFLCSTFLPSYSPPLFLNLPLIYPYSSPTQPLFYPYYPPTIPLFYPYSTFTLPLFFPCSTLILLPLYPYFTSYPPEHTLRSCVVILHCLF